MGYLKCEIKMGIIELRLWGRNAIFKRVELHGVDQIKRTLLALAEQGGQIESTTMPRCEENLCIAVVFSPRN